jgi:hypothetical protein
VTSCRETPDINDPGLAYADVPPPYLQRLVFSGAAPKGRVAYHRAFDG